ncbi:MAG: dipeptide ABC transporter ATP-binding protein [Gammaproteobacteria bacterium]|nr:dipeptide ABC transporter ATP-binding protein [Gammaproteobacteria bacterium]
MNDLVLKVEGLTTCFDTASGSLYAVDGVGFEICRGETLALLGESGCGKSLTAFSLMRLLPTRQARIAAGRVVLGGDDLLALPELRMRDIRGNRMAMIFQEPMTSLNPVMTVGEQIAEAVVRHGKLRGRALASRVIELLDAVGIPDAAQRSNEYPHMLSGGMKQRIMIAMALAGEPDLLIADEPTTALDVTIQAQVLELMRDLQRSKGMAILLITHDLGVVAEMADRVAVMYAGQIVEQAESRDFFASPCHPYSRKLFDSLPTIAKRHQPLAIIKGNVPPLTAAGYSGCRFATRCDMAKALCEGEIPQLQDAGPGRAVRCFAYDDRYRGQWGDGASAIIPAAAARPQQQESGADGGLLAVRDLKVYFKIQKGLFKRTVGHIKAVDGVSISIGRGRTLALVGESGCGKTTVAKAILQLQRPTSGSVLFNDVELTTLGGEALRRSRADFQIIFQDPYSSMNPRMLVGDIIQEGMIALGVEPDPKRRALKVDELLQQVGLPPEAKGRYPHEFSGGQRQRVCIARALAVNPKLIICDEPTSALDISVQAQILNLLQQLQRTTGVSYLFITHNLSVVAYLADEVAVMYLGRIVEQGRVSDVLTAPRHPYTQALISAIPVIDAGTRRETIRLEGDLPSPANPPTGCHFHVRCPQARPECSLQYPEAAILEDGRMVRCVLYPRR